MQQPVWDSGLALDLEWSGVRGQDVSKLDFAMDQMSGNRFHMMTGRSEIDRLRKSLWGHPVALGPCVMDFKVRIVYLSFPQDFLAQVPLYRYASSPLRLTLKYRIRTYRLHIGVRIREPIS
jgi:hypothetical protein